jgi:hypothetical protein
VLRKEIIPSQTSDRFWKNGRGSDYAAAGAALRGDSEAERAACRLITD